jgi:hypothetical protein
MLAFPQLPSGATGQYPIKKHCAQRTIVNLLPDGHAVKYADSGAAISQWQLAYQSLTDSELDTLQQFFVTCEGQLIAFTLLDPLGNLLAWSEALNQPAWEASTLLQMTVGISDPTGGTSATRITNPTGADLTLQQTINAPGWFTYCFSLYVRGQSGAILSLLLQAGSASESRSYAAQTAWNRLSLGGSLNTTETSLSTGIVIPAGQSVDVFGFQLEPQPAPSTYKPSLSAGGVHANAHFDDDAFTYTTSGPNSHACVLTITAH